MYAFLRIVFLGLVIFYASAPAAHARIVTSEEQSHSRAELEKHYYLRAEIFVNYTLNAPDIFNMDMYHSGVYRGPETFVAALASLESLRTYFAQTKEAAQQAELYFESAIKASTAPDSYKESFIAGYKKQDAHVKKDSEAFFANEQEILNLLQRHIELLQKNTAILSTENDTYCFPGHDEVAQEYDAIIDQLEKLFDKKATLLMSFNKNMLGFGQKFKALQKTREGKG